MNRAVIRVFLLIVYGLLSFVITLLSIRSDGYGSKLPSAITFSWGILPWQSDLVSGLIGFSLLPVFYLLCLFTLTTIGVRSSRLLLSLLPIAFHSLGIAVALMNVKPGEPVTLGYLTTSVVLAGAYLGFDWWLAGRQRPFAHHARNAKASVSVLLVFYLCLCSGCITHHVVTRKAQPHLDSQQGRQD